MSIKSFKLSSGSEEDGVDGDMGILIVKNMLLTGFEAPIEQVMFSTRSWSPTACCTYHVFYDEDLRFDFMLPFKRLTKSLNLLFPARQVLEFMGDYKVEQARDWLREHGQVLEQEA